MKTFVLECPEIPKDAFEAEQHLKARGIDYDFIPAIHGETFGLLPGRPYNENRPGRGELIPISQVGLTLSHYMTWVMCSNLPDDYFMILEADAKFPMNWKEILDVALEDLPKDWDIFLIGNSHTTDKEEEHICGDVWIIKYPFTTHAYLVRKKALDILLTTCRDATVPIDILMIRKAYPLLKVYTMLPRLVEQRWTDLPV